MKLKAANDQVQEKLDIESKDLREKAETDKRGWLSFNLWGRKVDGLTAENAELRAINHRMARSCDETIQVAKNCMKSVEECSRKWMIDTLRCADTRESEG